MLYRTAYQDFLDVLVDNLLTATAGNTSAAFAHRCPISKRFRAPSTPPRENAAGAGVSQTQSGPRYADFFYVAGKRDEIQPLGRSVENYGAGR